MRYAGSIAQRTALPGNRADHRPPRAVAACSRLLGLRSGGRMTADRAIGWGMGALPRIVRGEGSYLYDASGRRYLDGSGGPAAVSIGHGHREVNAAIAAQ